MSDLSDLTIKMDAHGGRDHDPLVTLSTGADSKVFQVKKSVLCAHSEYFKSTFNFDNDNCNVVLDPKNFAPEALSKLVAYMETGEILPDMENIECLIYAADYLQMESVLNILMEFLHIDMKNYKIMDIPKHVLLMYVRLWEIVDRVTKGKEFGKLFLKVHINSYTSSYGPVRLNLYVFLRANFKRIWFEKCILEQNEKFLWEVLDSDYLKCKEEEVLRFIKLWINFDFPARQHLFKKLIRMVRCTSLPIKVLVEEVLCFCTKDCQCLTSQEYYNGFTAKKYAAMDIPYLHGPMNQDDRKNDYITFEIYD